MFIFLDTVIISALCKDFGVKKNNNNNDGKKLKMKTNSNVKKLNWFYYTKEKCPIQ